MIVEIDSVAAAEEWLRTHVVVGETNVIFKVADDVDIMAVPMTYRRCKDCGWFFFTGRLDKPSQKGCPKCGQLTIILSKPDKVVQGDQTILINSQGSPYPHSGRTAICRKCKHHCYGYYWDCFVPGIDSASFDCVSGTTTKYMTSCFKRNSAGECQLYKRRWYKFLPLKVTV